MSRKSLLVDFDGVIRQWNASSILAAEEQCNVGSGTVLETAFSESLLQQVITGDITHSEWEEAVGSELSGIYGGEVSECLVNAWIKETWEIDEFLLDELCCLMPNHQLVLVTNATDRLQQDLIKSDLEDRFDFIINSSRLGVAKPGNGFYHHALAISNSLANDCVYIDDSPGHIEAAEALGIRSVLHESVENTLERVKHAYT